jgi:hypothetical protein
MKRKTKAKRYVTNVVTLIFLTVAAIFLLLGRVSPDAIKDETNRNRIF